MLLNSRQRIAHDLEAVAVVVREISTGKLKSNLAFLLTFSISKAFLVQRPDFEKMLLNSRRRITHDLEAVTVVVHEISTSKLKSNFDFSSNIEHFYTIFSSDIKTLRKCW